jgi:hypothetical protein
MQGKSGRGVRLTTPFHLIPRSTVVELHFHYPTRLYGVVLNYLGAYISVALTTGQ